MRIDALGYISGEAEGAYPNGTRIVKIESEESDSTPVGSGGEVIASHYVGDIPPPAGVERPVTYFYFVTWDWLPAVPVGISDWKIGKEDV